MNPDLLAAFARRGVELQLMGFGRAELKQILAAEMSHAPTESEWDAIFRAMAASLRDFELDEEVLNTDLNVYVQRSQWIQGQLLSLFNNMLRNYNAMSEGKMEHEAEPGEEPEPVLPVKPADIAAMGEKILKLDQERLSAKLSYPQGVQKAKQALAASDDPKNALPGHDELMGVFYEDDEDDEGEEASDADFQASE